jgi:hypothetical protein
MEVVELLEMNLADFRTIEGLAIEQESKLAKGAAEEFTRASQRRDTIQESIQKRSEKIRALLNESTGAAVDSRVWELKEEIGSVASRVAEIDTKILALAEEERDRALRDVMQLKQGRQGLKGYVKRPGAAPRFLDKEG